MLFFSSLNFLLISFCVASVITVPPRTQNGELTNTDLLDKLEPHIIQFLELVDMEKVVNVAMEHIAKDPDVLKFFEFLLSQEFKDLMQEFERLAEVQEAIQLVRSKVYDMQKANDFVNTQSNFQSPVVFTSPSRNSQGVSEVIEDIFQVLPLDKMKELFEKKLKTDAEIAKLFETVSSEEFLDVLQRLKVNPKALEIKERFENLGLDFDYLKKLIRDIFGDYFQKISLNLKQPLLQLL